MDALVNFDKPLVAAVHGAAIGGGTTMLTHCDFIYAGESTKFQMPFINLAVVPEFGSSCSVPARIGHVRAAELILLGVPFDARRVAELGLVTEVVSEKDVLARATETARKLAAKPAAALQASKRLMKQPFREQIKAAMKVENEEFSAQVSSDDAKEALTAFLEKRKPDFTRAINPQRPHRNEHTIPPTRSRQLKIPTSWRGYVARSATESSQNEASRIRFEPDIIVENDHGKADECVRVGRKPAEGFVQRDAGECTDLARTIFDEARNRRDRTIAFLQSRA
jgi:hypothetical protein